MGRSVHRGVEVGIYLRPGLEDEPFVARALGNLAAFDLERRRGERLEWQILRVEGSRAHRYRLVIRHPERPLDVGLKSDLARELERLSRRSVDDLRADVRAAEAAGLREVPLRRVRDEADFWQDDFWTWLGGALGVGPT
jgi:hypothetical protein